MAVFDYSRLRARLDDYATERWPAARLAVIVDEHQQETCFRAIGARLGISKNAVVSQAHRIGLPCRPKRNGQSLKPRPARPGRTVVKPKPPKPPVPSALDLRHARRAEVKAALALSALHHGLISDLAPNSCKWPVGDPKAADFGFCGRPRGRGPYCCDHQGAAVDRSVTTKSHRGGIDRLAALEGRASSITGAWA